MAINTEMRVTGIAEYKNAMSQARQSVKTLDDELKKSEAQYKATGDKETYMADKTRILQKQLTEQSKAAKAAENALKQMKSQGVDPSSTAYQKMESELYKAQAQMFSTTSALDQLKRGELEAASGADQLTASVNGISKKMSIGQVISGIDSITGGLENAAKKAVSLGQALFKNVMDRAAWADDVATAAKMLGMGVEDYQRYEGVFSTVGEITIQDWMTAKRKVEDAIFSPSKEQAGILELLGIDTHETISGAKGDIQGAAKDWETIFWEVSEEIKKRVENGSLSQGLADQYFEAIFGKKYMNYKNLIDLGQEGFKEALGEWQPVGEKEVNDLATMNDTWLKTVAKWEAIMDTIVAKLAPSLTSAVESISGLLDNVLDYMNTEEGQEMLDNLGKAVEGLFTDISKIDPSMVVEGFTKVFNTIVTGLQWLVDNKDIVIGALEGIVIGWAGLKLTGGALKVLELINGINGLKNTKVPSLPYTEPGTPTTAPTAGPAAGGGLWAALKTMIADAMPFLATDAAVIGLASLPAILAQNADYQASAEKRASRVQSAGNAETPNEKFLLQAANALVLEGGKNKDFQAISDLLMGLGERQNQERAQLYNTIQRYAPTTGDGNYTWNQLMRYWSGAEFDAGAEDALLEAVTTAFQKEIDANNAPKIPIQPEVPEDAAATISEDIGPVTVPVLFSVEEMGPEETAAFFGAADGSHANGIWSVPFDGYRAILHRGERVTPAREIASRNFSSNLYVESMIMSGNTDAEGLAAAMAAAQRRTMNGYGS